MDMRPYSSLIYRASKQKTDFVKQLYFDNFRADWINVLGYSTFHIGLYIMMCSADKIMLEYSINLKYNYIKFDTRFDLIVVIKLKECTINSYIQLYMNSPLY